jgi:hypothetical protein
MKVEGYQYSPIVKFDDFRWNVRLSATPPVLSNNTPLLYSIGIPSINPIKVEVLFEDYLVSDFTDGPYSPWHNNRLFYITKRDNDLNLNYIGGYGGDFEVFEPGVSYDVYLFPKETTNIGPVLGIQ